MLREPNSYNKNISEVKKMEHSPVVRAIFLFLRGLLSLHEFFSCFQVNNVDGCSV